MVARERLVAWVLGGVLRGVVNAVQGVALALVLAWVLALALGGVPAVVGVQELARYVCPSRRATSTRASGPAC